MSRTSSKQRFRPIIILLFVLPALLPAAVAFSWPGRSPVTAGNTPAESPPATVVIRVDTAEPLLALTFDDGPSNTFTPQVLEILARYRARATFFVVGRQVERSPALVARIHAAGHEIGNHTFSHPYGFKSAAHLERELTAAASAIYRVTGRQPVLFRPPGGHISPAQLQAARQLGYTVVGWTPADDARDWAGTPPGRIAERITHHVQKGDILIFHDCGGDRTNSVQALELVLQELQKRGFGFVTVSELLRAGSPVPPRLPQSEGGRKA
ncbi:MAG: polysaccharide deacetylase family protein [Desulfurispora sp.]|uniref:polysaccharide deacetylase family protein n=1 Tax=Desulfurispora sp. TaxID=3014275 RepID=UPI00404AD7A4